MDEAIWLARGRVAKYSLASALPIVVALHQALTCRLRFGQEKTRQARLFFLSCLDFGEFLSVKNIKPFMSIAFSNTMRASGLFLSIVASVMRFARFPSVIFAA